MSSPPIGAEPGAPRRGRPRSVRAEAAVVAAATRLLATHGLAGLTMEGVAEQAGVSKATLYKWWPSKGALALDVLLRNAGDGVAVPDTGDLAADLTAHLQGLVRYLRDGPAGRTIAELLGEAQHDAGTGQTFRRAWLEPRRAAARARLLAAVEHGELRTGLDLDVVMDILYGPVYYRLLTGHALLDDGLAAAVVAAALPGLSTTVPPNAAS